MARPKTSEGKQTAIRLRTNQRGWIEWMKMQGAAPSLAAYICDLIDKDRMERMSDPETDRRYRLYLEACGMDEELAYLKGLTADPEG